MARPKTGKPPKKSLNLTVTEQTREQLALISAHYGESISSLIAQWAESEAQKVGRVRPQAKNRNMEGGGGQCL